MNQTLIILILLNLMVISLTALFALNRLDLFLKQFFFWVIGFLLFFSFYFINYRFIFEKYFFYSIIAFSFLILIIVLLTPGNLKSWLKLGIFALQPAEFSKIGFFLLLSNFLSHYHLDLINPIYFLYSVSILIPYLALIILQPDWGMAFLYFLIWILIIVSYLSKKEIISFSLILIFIFSLLWLFVLKDYQKARILVFINPEIDPLKTGYNVRQIKLTIGTSDFWGKGVGLGEIGRLGYLPSATTDFILAALIEERGILIFIVYSILIFLLIFEFSKTQIFNKNPLIKNFVFIISQYFLAKYILTTLVNFGLFPIIGLPIPFLSYGGSHLIFDLWILGIYQSLVKERV